MKITCSNCSHFFEGTVTRRNSKWYSVCPECGKEVKVTLPKGQIIMAFVDDSDPEQDAVNFTDDFKGINIRTYYAFDTPESFIEKWKEVSQNPDGMWYWCLNGNYCFCSGACDPGDISIFREYFKRRKRYA